jgi:hypothetical protein
MQNLKLSNSGKSLPFSKGPYKPGQTQSLLSSNLESLSLLGQSTAASADPKGQVLRQVRLSLGLDPSVLASQSCISLAQLYELEEGWDSRFYSPSLRQQAARKVSRILGLEWDDPNLAARLHLKGRKVVQMQRPAAHPVLSVLSSAEVSELGCSTVHLIEQGASHSEPRDNGPEQSLAALLSTASADSVDVSASAAHFQEDVSAHHNSGSVTLRIFVFVFVLMVTAAAMAGYFWSIDAAQVSAGLNTLIGDPPY